MINKKCFEDAQSCETDIIRDVEEIKAWLRHRQAQKKLDIVLCDDDPVVIKALETACKAADLAFRSTTSVAECLNEIQKNDIGVLIIDYVLTDGTAVDILEQKPDMGTGRYPIFVYTDMDMASLNMDTLCKHQVSLFSKVVSAEELIQYIKAQL